MNCQEYRELIEDALDASINGEPERHVRRHLEHCEACRTYFETRHAGHVALFTGINAACANLHLPEGFADRLAVSARTRRAARRSWRRFALPRWALIAASLVVVAGFVFAAAVAGGRLYSTAEFSSGDDTPTAREGTDATDETEATAVSSADTSIIPSVPSVPSVSSISTKGETTTMNKLKAATAALSAAMAAAPLAATNGDEYQFIDPTTYPAANVSHSALSGAIALDTGVLSAVGAADDLEARSRSDECSAAITLNATKLKMFIISIQ